MIATQLMLLDFIENASPAVIDAIVPDDTSVVNLFALDYTGLTLNHRMRRKRERLRRDVMASIKRGKQEWMLKRLRRLENQTLQQLMGTSKRARL